MTLFQDVLDEELLSLPQSLQDFHNLTNLTWRGEANVQTGSSPLAKIAAKVVGLNVKSGKHPLTVTLKQDSNSESWERNFGGQKFQSRYTVGTGYNKGCAIESFGVISVALALVQDGNKLCFIPKRCTVLGIRLPTFLLPKGESYETEKDGKFHFNVAVTLPFIGLIAAYEGWLEPS